MSKERLKLYKGKRVVVGDKNLVTQHEIHIEDLGGSSSSGSESMIEYLDLSGADDDILYIAKKSAMLLKWKSTLSSSNGKITIGPPGIFGPPSSDGQEAAIYMAMAIDLSLLIVASDAGAIEPTPLSSVMGYMFADLPRITEEQFYNLNNN